LTVKDDESEASGLSMDVLRRVEVECDNDEYEGMMACKLLRFEA